MAKLSVTEALAEVSLIEKKVASKRAYISQNLGRSSAVGDPLEKSGGSDKVITETFQAISDLDKRRVAIRSAIQGKNCEAKLTINERTMSITDWLNTRREVAPGHLDFLKQLNTAQQQLKTQFERQPQILKGDDGKQTIITPVFHIDPAWVQKELETWETMMGELDGKLSYLNATTFIEI